MNVKKMLRKIEKEYQISFPFRLKDVSVCEIVEEDNLKDKVECYKDKAEYHKQLLIASHQKEDAEYYISYMLLVKKHT